MYLLITGAADSLFVSRKLLQCYKNRLEKEVEEIQFSTDWASDKMCQVTVFASWMAMWELVWDSSSVVTQLRLGESQTNHEYDSLNTGLQTTQSGDSNEQNELGFPSFRVFR